MSETEDVQGRVSRRTVLKTAAYVTLLGGSGTLGGIASAEDVPPEPDNLDEPTEWQEGDPEPQEMQVPPTEPEQTSQEAPPSQPMADDMGAPPSDDAVWASGYWWYTNNEYKWVPGYWTVPPNPEYVYAPGYWTYKEPNWSYVRGGWGQPDTTVVVQHETRARPLLTALVITAPIRIVRRHRRWRHHHARHMAHHRRSERVGKTLPIRFAPP